MKKTRLLSYHFTIFLMAFLLPFCLVAQEPVYKPHQLINAGKGLQIEIIKCALKNGDEQCDAIFFAEKRQLGIRKWISTNLLRQIEDLQIKKDSGRSFELSDFATAISFSDSILSALNKSVVKRITATSLGMINPQKKNLYSPSLKDDKQKTSATLQPDVFPLNLSNNSNQKVEKAAVSFPQTIYTLEDCFQIGLANNTTLRLAKNKVATASIDNKTSRANLLPSFSFDMGHYFSFGKNIDPVTNNFSFETFSGGYSALSLQLQLFNGFKKLNQIKQSALLISSAEYNEKKIVLDIRTKITMAYALILQSSAELVIKRGNISTTKKELEIISEKVKNGRLTRYDFYAFNGLLNTQEAEVANLKNDSSTAMQNLRLLLNIPHDKSFSVATIDTSIFDKIYATSFSIDSLGETLMSKHPDLKEAEMNKKAVELSQRIAHSALLPTLAISGNVVSNYNNDQTTSSGEKISLSRQLNDNLGQNINISLRIPIFSQLQNANRIKKEKINLDNAQIAIEEAKNRIFNNAQQMVNDFETAKSSYRSNLIAYQQNILSYELYQEKYKLGMISSVEVLAAQNILQTSTTKYLQSKLNLFFQYQILKLLKSI